MNITIKPHVPQPQGCEIKLVPLKNEPWKPGLYRSTGDTDTVLFATSFDPDRQTLTGTALRRIGSLVSDDIGLFSRTWSANDFIPSKHDVVIHSTNLGDKYPQLARGPQGIVLLMFGPRWGLVLKTTDTCEVYGVPTGVGDLLDLLDDPQVVPFAGTATISND